MTRQVLIRATGHKEYKFGPPEWLRVIHAANDVEPDFFAAPSSIHPWWTGGTAEEYEHARVILRDGGNDVLIGSKTEHGCDVLKKAAAAMNISTVDTIVETFTRTDATVIDREV